MIVRGYKITTDADSPNRGKYSYLIAIDGEGVETILCVGIFATRNICEELLNKKGLVKDGGYQNENLLHLP